VELNAEVAEGTEIAEMGLGRCAGVRMLAGVRSGDADGS
jgi:hypothetical protein